MLYAALAFWLLVAVFSAWAVHALWSTLAKPRAVNAVLLPGTLVAQLGHVLGLLVTGQGVRDTALMSDDESGEPRTDRPEPGRQKLPVVGSVIVGLLPLAACAGGIYAAAHFWGGSVIGRSVGQGGVELAQQLPTTLGGVWDLLRAAITASERMLTAIVQSNWTNWTTILFLYLAVCLTVRMAPFEGHRRGAVAAIGLAAVLVWLAGMASPAIDQSVRGVWPLLSFVVGMLLLLLLVSLLAVGLVNLARILVKEE